MVDNLDVIKCPACGKYMIKIYVPHVKKNIDFCLEGCGGIFFDNRELELFDEEHESMDELLAFYKDKVFTPAEDKKRKCSTCGAIMQKIGSGTNDNTFKIDTCYTCGAIFLDAYELQKIRNSLPTEEARTEYFNKEFMAELGHVLEKQRRQEQANDKNLYLKISPMKKFIDWFSGL